jgi:SagB-type dehydrogenase family enzyme
MKRTGVNWDITASLDYHERTKHIEERLRADPHFLDWANQPIPFKLYRSLESVPLPADAVTLTGTMTPAIEALSTSPDREARELDLAALARLLFLGAGITKRRRRTGREVYFRAYPNTGALYHVDLYLVTGPLDALPAGVWHFGPNDFALHRLRDGDYRGALVEASGAHPRLVDAAAILVSASTYWRNAWKYRARTYRHCFWDAGTMHANLLAVAGFEGLDPCVVMGFADDALQTLLGLDPAREGALALVPIGSTAERASPAPSIESIRLETEPLSRSEIEYPEILAMHAASALAGDEEVATWRGEAPAAGAPAAGGPVQALAPMDEGAISRRSIAEVIIRRGSTRAFDAERAIGFDQLSSLLLVATGGLPADFLGSQRSTVLDLYLIVNAVDGLESGTYYFRREEGALERLAGGEFRVQAGRLGLDQELPADAAVNVYAICALRPVLERFGNRGYRAAQMEGGILGGRLYLTAYAFGLGATGLTFYDDEVIEFFSPHAAGKDVMFLTAIGHADHKRLRPQIVR